MAVDRREMAAGTSGLESDREADGGVRRREFVKGAGAAGLVLGGSGLLAACGSSSSPSSGTTSSAFSGNPSTPKPGGTLRVALPGNGTSESYSPLTQATPIDSLHVLSVFDPWIRPAPYQKTEPGLAVEWTPNADATVWEIKLREGVTWHDGTPLTADDAIYTLRAMATPTSILAATVADIRLNDIRKLSDQIIQVPLTAPNARLYDRFLTPGISIFKNGTKSFSKPMGTGPYKLESFTPGQRSVLTANRDYWDHPRPYPDTLEIISIDDPTARANALSAGEIDIASSLTYATARAQMASNSGSWKVFESAPGQNFVLPMRVDVAPFSDNRVRLAMKLIADRPGLVEAALDGFGVEVNDLLGQGEAYYDASLPQRHQDIEQAKSLLKAAGRDGMTVTLNTSDVYSGVQESATAYAEQAKAAGITVNVKTIPIAQYYTPPLYPNMPFFSEPFLNTPLQSLYSLIFLTTSSDNETHWHDPSFDTIVNSAIGELDTTKAQELWSEAQRIQYEQGGYIVWGRERNVNGYSPRVAGFGGPGAGWFYTPDDIRVWNWGFA